MRLLSIDPGITTGFALLDIWEGDELIDVGELEIKNLGLLKEKSADVIIMEQVPTPSQSPMNRRLESVNSLLISLFPSVIMIMPSHWKTHPASQRPIPQRWQEDFPILASSQHARDALGMAVYYVIVR